MNYCGTGNSESACDQESSNLRKQTHSYTLTVCLADARCPSFRFCVPAFSTTVTQIRKYNSKRASHSSLGGNKAHGHKRGWISSLETRCERTALRANEYVGPQAVPGA